MDTQITSKEAQRWTQWVQQACAIFPYIVDNAESTSKHLHLHNIALWQQARITLIRVFHLHSHHDASQMGATRHQLQRLGISPKVYTFQHHNATSIVYIRLTLSRGFSKFRYIGCSHHNLQHREASRNRKFKQVQENKIVHAELAIRWWAKHNNYQQYVPITIQHSIAEDKLDAAEITLIQRLQPKLNHPFIAPHMRRSLRYIHRQGKSKATGFCSIWAKVRRNRLPHRMQDIHKCHTFTSQLNTWTILCDLSSNTRRRFEGIKTQKQDQPDRRLRPLPHGQKHGQCAQTSGPKSLKNRLKEKTDAATIAEPIDLRPADDAPAVRSQPESLPQTGSQ